jgi:hypothetical protein
MSVFPTAACTIWAACRSTARRLGRRELAPAISRPSAACQRSVPGRRDGRPCVRVDPHRTNRLSGAVPLKVRPVSLSSHTVGVATRDPRSAEVGGATDDRVRSPASAEGGPGSGATIAVGSTETPSRRANVGPLCQIPCLPGSIESPSAAARWRWHAITGSSRASRSNRSPTDSAARRRRSRPISTTRPGRRPVRSSAVTRGLSRLRRTHRGAGGQGRRVRTLQTLPPGRDRVPPYARRGARGNARVAGALRQPTVVNRLVSHARPPTRRRSARPIATRRLACPVDGHRPLSAEDARAACQARGPDPPRRGRYRRLAGTRRREPHVPARTPRRRMHRPPVPP